MPDLIRWLLNEPIVLLILIGWIFSMIGGAMQKAARKAQQERTGGRRPGEAPRDTAAGPAPSRRPDPEEIAREIRRAMGLERSEPAPRPKPPSQPPAREARPAGVGGASAPRRVDYDELAQRPPRSFDERPPRTTVDHELAQPRRGLREEMADRDLEVRHLGSLENRDAHLGDNVSSRHLEVRAGKGLRTEPRRRAELGRGRVLDLTRPAAAIVAMEVLGRPIALRKSPMPHDI